ncbi:MAG TPA: ABC transporter substrate-binding protein [Xanthobacteraceae bacterium]|jgi:NitT/TauT family transport system substrate-binding protein
MKLALRLTVLSALLGIAGAAQAQELTIRVGMVRSITSVVVLRAIEQGYFKPYGIKVETEFLDTSANSIALVAQNHFQIIEGGIAAAYFNALEKSLPVTIAIDRVSSPIGHNLMLRPDLAGTITALHQLKGRTIATNGQGAVSTYEVGKMLETDGLTIADVDIKVLPFTQYAVAFRNKAVDAGIVIPPFTAQLLDGGFAVNFKDPDELVKPWPLNIAVNIINTDWAKANEQALKSYYVGYLRAAREYCQAYHGGAQRRAIIDLSVRTGTETRPELLEKYPWPARDPDGRVNLASMQDMNDWFVRNRMSAARFPPERLVDNRYVEYAVRQLGPFVLENKASPLAGCR